jgi:hypothetical protein
MRHLFRAALALAASAVTLLVFVSPTAFRSGRHRRKLEPELHRIVFVGR